MNLEHIKEHFHSNEWPQFVSGDFDENSVSLTLQIGAQVRWFEGHFPEQPVLAGVVQTHWAAELGRYIFGVDKDFTGIDNLKFQSVILPDMCVQVSLVYDVEKNTVKFKYFDSENTYSEGRINFVRDV